MNHVRIRYVVHIVEEETQATPIPSTEIRVTPHGPAPPQSCGPTAAYAWRARQPTPVQRDDVRRRVMCHDRGPRQRRPSYDDRWAALVWARDAPVGPRRRELVGVVSGGCARRPGGRPPRTAVEPL